MRSGLALGVLLSGAVSVVAAVGGAVLAVVVIPLNWRGTASVSVDWSAMPIEASGDKRELIGSFFKYATSHGSVAVRDAFVKQSTIPSRCGISKQHLADTLTFAMSDESNDSAVVFEVVARDSDRERCAIVVREATEYVRTTFEGYRVLEGLGQAFTLGREADQTREYGPFWFELFSMALADPVRVTMEPSVEPDVRRSALAAILLGGFLGVSAGIATMLGSVLIVRGRLS